MTLFVRRCGARLRGKAGQRCRAPALKGCAHCRIHAGRPRHSCSPEGEAATRAGHAAHYAKRRAAKSRGEAVLRSGGRKRKWPIPRPWRFRLTEAEQAIVLAAQLDAVRRGPYDPPPWQRGRDADLEALERTFIARMRDRARPLAEDEVDRLFRLILSAEQTLALPGAEARLERLRWERNQWYLRRPDAADMKPAARSVQRAVGIPSPADDPPETAEDAARRADDPDQAIAAEIDRLMRRLAQFPLVASARQQLDRELARAGSSRERLAVLTRQIAQIERANEDAAARAAGRFSGGAWAAPAPEPAGPRFLIIPRRRP
jgi:hypothetical protein